MGYQCDVERILTVSVQIQRYNDVSRVALSTPAIRQVPQYPVIRSRQSVSAGRCPRAFCAERHGCALTDPDLSFPLQELCQLLLAAWTPRRLAILVRFPTSSSESIIQFAIQVRGGRDPSHLAWPV